MAFEAMAVRDAQQAHAQVELAIGIVALQREQEQIDRQHELIAASVPGGRQQPAQRGHVAVKPWLAQCTDRCGSHPHGGRRGKARAGAHGMAIVAQHGRDQAVVTAIVALALATSVRPVPSTTNTSASVNISKRPGLSTVPWHSSR